MYLTTMEKTLKLVIICVLVTQVVTCPFPPIHMNRHLSVLINKLETCGVGPAEVVGTVNDNETCEASGLTSSYINEKLFWTINDSAYHATSNDCGGTPHVFGLDESGDTVAKLYLNGANNTDWEAITTAPCEAGAEKRCIYIADIGDNCRRRDHVTIYKFVEPNIYNSENLRYGVKGISIDTYHMKYPNGERHNCEAIIIDPITRDLLLFIKELNITDEKCKVLPVYCLNDTYPNPTCEGTKVYSTPVDNLDTDGIVVLKDENITIPFMLPTDVATDASTSEDENTVIIRSYNSTTIYRKKNELMSVLEMLREMEPCFIEVEPIQEKGEGVALLQDGSAYYLNSEFSHEGRGQNITKYTFSDIQNITK